MTSSIQKLNIKLPKDSDAQGFVTSVWPPAHGLWREAWPWRTSSTSDVLGSAGRAQSPIHGLWHRASGFRHAGFMGTGGTTTPYDAWARAHGALSGVIDGQQWPLIENPPFSYAIFRVRHTLFCVYGFVDTLSKSMLEAPSQGPC
jgi:hypothetical protein